MELLARTGLTTTLKDYLHIQGSAVESRALLSEYARLLIFQSTGAISPVHTTRILDGLTMLAKDLLAPSSTGHPSKGNESSSDREACRDLLDDLNAIGDIENLGRGFWLPAPMRVIKLDDTRSLLVGGVPTADLPLDIRSTIMLMGVARTVPTARFYSASDNAIWHQSLTSWLGDTRELVSWTRHILKEPLQDYAGDDDSYQFYAPKLPQSRGQAQYFRWEDSPDLLEDDIYLVRIRVKGRPRHYSLAKLQGHRIVAFRELPRSVELRRLLYGLDLLAHNPVYVKCLRETTDTRFIIKSTVPQSLHRLLVAVGTYEPPPPGKHFPITWRVANNMVDTVLREFRKLKVRVA